MAQNVRQESTVSGSGAALFNVGEIGEIGHFDRSTHQTLNVTGTGSSALVIGEIGAVGHLGNLQVMADTQFFELKIEELRPDPLFEPPAVARLVDRVLEDRILILAGSLDDKTECARHLAYELRRRLGGDDGCAVVVRQAWQGKDPGRIESALDSEGPTILLLTEISKSQVAGYGPAKLREVLKHRNGYAIITTDCSRSLWDLESHGYEARIWNELSWETYYGGGQALARYLTRLIDTQAPVPRGVLLDVAGEVQLIEGLSVFEVAEKLRSPARLRYLVRWILGEEEAPSLETLRARLAELSGDPAGIRSWYQQFEPRDQLLVVGLALLDGLPDDLLFACLELLVDTVWRGTDPLLAQFDYRDLSRFAAYFKETRVDSGRVRIESGSREQRRQILRVAWQQQRRRLLATLPALTEMIRLAASHAGEAVPETPGREVLKIDRQEAKAGGGAAAARSLGRTGDGSARLQEVLVEALSLVGLLSIEVVEPYLLELAADPVEEVQHLVAAALAAWREEDKDEELFNLLRGWWAEGSMVGDVTSRIGRLARREPDSWAAVRASVALTVGYAASRDREDGLKPELIELLSRMIVDTNPRVRGVVIRHTLPRTIAWHLRQLEALLRTKALASPELVTAVAQGAAAASELRPEVCLPILESWRVIARSESSIPSLPRAAMLATVARSYGFIRCDDEQPRLSTATITSKLRAILVEEADLFVRRQAFLAVEAQTRRDFGIAAELLPAVLARVTLEDRPAVVQLAVRTYLHQRQLLKGGDKQVAISGRSFDVWTTSRRPLTGLEASLYGWILDDSRPIAQQLAVDIFTALSDTALDHEERSLRQVQPASVAAPMRSARRNAPPVAKMNPLPLLGQLAVFLAAPRKPQLRKVMKPLLAEVIVEYHRRPLPERAGIPPRGGSAPPPRPGAAPSGSREPTGSAGPRPSSSEVAVGAQRIDRLLSRWAGVRNATTSAVVAYLRRALTFYRWRWGLVLAAMVLLIVAGCVGKGAWTVYSRYRAAEAAQGAPATTEPADAASDPSTEPFEEIDHGTEPAGDRGSSDRILER